MKKVKRILLQDDTDDFYTDLIEFEREVDYIELYTLIEDCKNRLKNDYTNKDIYSAIDRLGVPYKVIFMGTLDKISY